jgi:hypothetical protein
MRCVAMGPQLFPVALDLLLGCLEERLAEVVQKKLQLHEARLDLVIALTLRFCESS